MKPLAWALGFALGAALATGAFYGTKFFFGRWMR